MNLAASTRTRPAEPAAVPQGPSRLRIAGPAERAAIPSVRRPYRPPPGGLVERRGLVRRLTTTTAPLAILIAPAGYGKSMALASWAEHDARPFAWISALPADNDPRTLLGSLTRALGDVESLPTEVVAALPDRHTGFEEILVMLTGALHLPRRPAVLVVDDAQVLDDPEAFELLTAVAEHLGEGSMLVLASRREPAMPLGRLRAEGLVLELRVADLAMTSREASAVLRRTGVHLSPDVCAALLHRTEGWPAALRLAGLVLRAEDDAGGAAARLRGDARVLADYVRDTVLAPLSADAFELLLRSSPLEVLSGPLCDAVTQRSGAGRMLCHLARAGVPLAPLDCNDEHFRLHGLVADALRSELRRRDPGGEQEAHRRASAFFEELGDIDAAVEHAIAARDHRRVGRLVWELGSTGLVAGRVDAIDGWLRRLGDGPVGACPELALTAAVVALRRGDRDAAERWTEAAARRLDEGAGPCRPDLEAAMASLRAAVARETVDVMGREAGRARTLAPGGSHWRAFACYLEGTALHLLDQPQVARARLEEGARLAARGLPVLRILCLAQLGLLALLDDDVPEALAHCDDARADIARARLHDEPCCAMAYAVSAFARAQDGRVREAREDITAARRLARGRPDSLPWYDAELRLALARSELRLSDAGAARELLGHAGRSLRRLPGDVLIHGWFDDAWARADTFAEGAVITPSILTTAELRVLRFLPSHLSFREIAARLQVSSNTVKTQAHAVYRKLDATSRSEAVARARGVGLIDA